MTVYTAGDTANPKGLVILLHGYGANGQDLIGLADIWAPQMPGIVFVSPDAPQPCDISPFGYQWFGLGDWSPVTMTGGVKKAMPGLNEFIDAQLKQYGLNDENLALVGFSQGTMMALYTATRRVKKIAGILGYSGALLGAEEWEKDPPKSKPDICLVHGLADNVVPAPACYHAMQGLEKNGFKVEGTVIPGLMHGIDDQGVEIGVKFLRRIFNLS